MKRRIIWNVIFTLVMLWYSLMMFYASTTTDDVNLSLLFILGGAYAMECTYMKGNKAKALNDTRRAKKNLEATEMLLKASAIAALDKMSATCTECITDSVRCSNCIRCGLPFCEGCRVGGGKRYCKQCHGTPES